MSNLTIFPNQPNEDQNRQNKDIQLAFFGITSWANRINGKITQIESLGGVQGPVGPQGPQGPAGNTVISKWANFQGRGTNGTCTINNNTNITSITRSSAGIYDIVFASAFASTNYGFSVTANSNTTKVIAASLYGAANKTTTGCTVAFYDIVGAALFDPADATVIFYN